MYDNLLEITTSLKSIKNNIASDAYKIMTSDTISDATEIMSDINSNFPHQKSFESLEK